MRKSRWLSAASGLGLVFALATVTPARAQVTELSPWAGQVDPAVPVASNLNSRIVAAVRSAGDVTFSEWLAPVEYGYLGRPMLAGGAAPATVKRLAVSAQTIFAVTTDGGLYEASTIGPVGWTRIGEDMVDVLASRDGTLITVPNQPPRLEPNVYGVDMVGRVWRRTGQGWFQIGADAGVGSLVERGAFGSTRLFELTADHSRVLEYTGTAWTPIGGPAEHLAANLTSLMMSVPGAGYLKLYDEPSGRWDSLAVAVGGPLVPFGGGGRFWLGDHSLYYRPPGRTELWGIRYQRPEFGDVLILPQWRVLSRAAIGTIAPIQPLNDTEGMAVTDAGVVGALRWGGPTTVDETGLADLQVGEETVYRTVPFDSWNGRMGVVFTEGDIPGMTIELRSDGQLEVAGTPTTAGTFWFTLHVVDESGGSARTDIAFLVRPTGTAGPAATSAFPHPAESVSLTTCARDASAARAWTRDLTSGTDWVELPPVPSARVKDSRGIITCAPTEVTPLTEPLPLGHVVEFAATYASDPLCGGADDPRLAGCRYQSFFATGAAQPPAVFSF